MRQWWYLPRHAGVLCTDFPPCLSSVRTPQAGGSRAGPWKGGGGCEGGTLPRTVKESELSLHFKLTGWPAGHILQVLTENTGSCAYCVCVCVCAQSYPTLCDPMNYSLPRSSVRGILQAKILEWVSISYYRGSSQPSD